MQGAAAVALIKTGRGLGCEYRYGRMSEALMRATNEEGSAGRRVAGSVAFKSPRGLLVAVR